MAQLGRDDVHDLYPEDVAKGLTEGRILLVDVREPNEPSSSAIRIRPRSTCRCRNSIRQRSRIRRQGGRVRMPLRQSFVTASLIAQNAGLPYNKHLAGGIKGWKDAGLPTTTDRRRAHAMNNLFSNLPVSVSR